MYLGASLKSCLHQEPTYLGNGKGDSCFKGTQVAREPDTDMYNTAVIVTGILYSGLSLHIYLESGSY
jgi:hypothetical protein